VNFKHNTLLYVLTCHTNAEHMMSVYQLAFNTGRLWSHSAAKGGNGHATG